MTALGVLAACDGDPRPPALQPLVSGEAQLSGYATQGCSEGATPGLHQWCSFYRPASDGSGRTELWVIDVTRALYGESLPCDGTSTGCLRMTERLFTDLRFESPSHPDGHRFEGDTLIFLAEPSPGSEDLARYEGLIWAWRPGWSRPRAISSARGVHCTASPVSATAYCVDGVTDRPRLEFDLRAGPLLDAEDSLLPVVERIVPLRGGNLVWSATFSPAGDSLVYSSWREDEAEEALRVLAFKEAGTRPARTVIESGRGWTLPPDGRSVYFFRDGSRESREATLWAADFPSGANAAPLHSDVYGLGLVPRLGQADSGIAFLSNPHGLEGTLNLMRDRRRPDQVVTLAENVHFWYSSADGRFSYVLQVDRQGERGLLIDNDRGTSCRLGSTPQAVAYRASFLPSFGLVSWNEPDPMDDNMTLTFLARPEDCGGVRLLGRQMDLLLPVGERGLIFGTDAGESPMSVFHVPVLDDRPLEELRLPILSGVDRSNLTFAGAGPDALILGTRSDASGERGLFAYGPLVNR